MINCNEKVDLKKFLSTTEKEKLKTLEKTKKTNNKKNKPSLRKIYFQGPF